MKHYPEFSWSISRNDLFLRCHRAYYFHFYESQNGWLDESSSLSKLAYQLKNITNVPMYLGEIIHEVLDDIVIKIIYNMNNYQQNPIPTVYEIVQELNHKIRTAIEQSQQIYIWRTAPELYTMLYEWYYTRALEEFQLEEIEDRIQTCIHNFFECKTIVELKKQPYLHYLESEKIRHFYINNIKSYLVMDFVYYDTNLNKWIIVDWKTGKSKTENKSQSALYAAYLLHIKKEINLEDIILRFEYLYLGTSKEFSPTEIDIKNIYEVQQTSIAYMLNMLVDPSYNIPLQIEDFQMTEEKSRCFNCNFKEICKR